MNSNNVVKLFPEQPSAIELFEGDSNQEPNDEGLEVNLEEIVEDMQITTYTNVCANRIGDELSNLGMDPQEAPKDFCFLVEAILSYIYKHHDREHALQDIAEDSIVIEDDETLIYNFIEPRINPIEENNGDSD